MRFTGNYDKTYTRRNPHRDVPDSLFAGCELKSMEAVEDKISEPAYDFMISGYALRV